MPRKFIKHADELAQLKAEEASLMSTADFTRQALSANRARQKELRDMQKLQERNKLGNQAQSSGLTPEQLAEAIARYQNGHAVDDDVAEVVRDSGRIAGL